MYDPIFSKSFSRNERKRFGCFAIYLSFIIALGIFLNLKPHFHLLTLIGDALKMQLSINAGRNMLTVDDGARGNIMPINAEYLQLPSNAAQNKLILNAPTTIKSTHFNINASKMKKVHATCRNSNYCEIEGDIRIEPNSSTIIILTQNSTKSWIIEPYPRSAMSSVKKWTVNLVQHEEKDDESIPKCTQYHSHPAILFSLGGFTGNFFHDFADVLFPLYSSSSHFKGEVRFLATDHKAWWISKFRHILNKLTQYTVLNIDGDHTSQGMMMMINCYKKLQIGLKFHKELISHHSLSRSTTTMQGFREILREAYSLERKSAIRPKTGDGLRPRLMIISRKRTRIMTNEDKVLRLAKKMGFEVVVAEAGVSSNVSAFAETVNSCDVLMGVHGAGLTNMVFLPDNAVVIQVVPFGGVDGFARLDFGNPAGGMNLRYLEYKILVRESSLRQQYSMDNPVLKNPESIKSWNEVWSIYLNQQNVTVDLRRFKGTLAKARKLLHH